MKKVFLLFYFLFGFACLIFSQSVGIGTTTPNAKAALEIKATDKGILFPRLTTTQRNLISNPPNGLMIFNTDERCINYYDSVYSFWNCYCADCQAVVINIIDDVCNVDFYNKYAKYAPAKKYIINISLDIYIHGCNPGDTALSFLNMPVGTSIIINNNEGYILGAGGRGGRGRIETTVNCPFSSINEEPGQTGGAAIATKTGVMVTVNNYGVVAGGGGGGGGSNKGATAGSGGGGGAGAGFVVAPGGNGGGAVTQTCSAFGCICVPTVLAQPGGNSSLTMAGNGGAGYNGGPAGGNGGTRGEPGQGGNSTAGGAGGKAIGGGSGNTINNLGSGQYYGDVD